MKIHFRRPDFDEEFWEPLMSPLWRFIAFLDRRLPGAAKREAAREAAFKACLQERFNAAVAALRDEELNSYLQTATSEIYEKNSTKTGINIWDYYPIDEEVKGKVLNITTEPIDIN
jgi:hypothetical protein